MSNRVLGILILLGFLGAGYIYYQLKYIPDQQQKEREQEERIQAIQELENQPKLVFQEKEGVESVSSSEKIAELKEKNKSYFYTSFDGIGDIKFTENNDKLDVFLNDVSLGSFSKVKKGDIEVQKVINDSNFLFFILGDEKFLYNIKNRTITSIELNVDIKYVKLGKDTTEFLFKTSVGIYVYSMIKDAIEYVHFFKDFVYFLDTNTKKYSYIGVIKRGEKKKLNNLGFDDLLSGNRYESLVVFYSPISKEKKILLQSDMNIDYIYTFDSTDKTQIFVMDELGETYELENL